MNKLFSDCAVSLRGAPRRSNLLDYLKRLLRPSGARNDTSIKVFRKLVLTGIFILSSACFNVSAQENLPFLSGETVVYEIKKMGLKVGQATLVFTEKVFYKGQNLSLITFIAKGPQFHDVEKIYIDPKTFYPKFVERDVDIFSNKEKISEAYDQDKGIITITKRTKERTSEQRIEKKGPIENIYGFIYRYRKEGTFDKNNDIAIHLPTKDVTMKFIKQSALSVMGKQTETFLLQSDPQQYSVWFDATSKHLPVRIDGAAGFGKTVMVLREVK